MKTQGLEGALLALWVARAMEFANARIEDGVCYYSYPYDNEWHRRTFDPVDDWLDAPQLIDSMNEADVDYKSQRGLHQYTFVENGNVGRGEGSSFMQALCRAIVNFMFGDELPDEVAK